MSKEKLIKLNYLKELRRQHLVKAKDLKRQYEELEAELHGHQVGRVGINELYEEHGQHAENSAK